MKKKLLWTHKTNQCCVATWYSNKCNEICNLQFFVFYFFCGLDFCNGKIWTMQDARHETRNANKLSFCPWDLSLNTKLAQTILALFSIWPFMKRLAPTATRSIPKNQPTKMQQNNWTRTRAIGHNQHPKAWRQKERPLTKLSSRKKSMLGGGKHFPMHTRMTP